VIGRFVAGLAAGATAALLVRRGHANGEAANGAATPDSNHGTNGEMRQLVGIIAHELRNPTAVILGYQELLAGGLLGPVNERTLEALERIRRAAAQLRDLTDGLQILTDDAPDRHNADNTVSDLGTIAVRCLDAALPDAQARNVKLDLVAEPDTHVLADPESVERLLDLVIAVALRAAPEEALQLSLVTDAGFVRVNASGVTFDPSLHGPALLNPPDLIDSGLNLRLAIAQRVATHLGGTLAIDPAGLLSLRLPAPAR
jgi:signal transduction histidine kinase